MQHIVQQMQMFGKGGECLLYISRNVYTVRILLLSDNG